MIIRPAKIEDCAMIGAFWHELVGYHQRLDKRLPSATPDGAVRYAQRIRDQLSDSYYHTLVAIEDNGTLIGYVTGMIIETMPDLFEHERCGLLADIYVLSTKRGQGIGKALVETMCDWFRLREVRYYEYHVAAQNEAGMTFWRSMQGKPVMARMRSHL